jgi:hypothetical protein
VPSILAIIAAGFMLVGRFLLLNFGNLIAFYSSDMEKRKKAVERLREQLAKLELQATDKEENKEIALSTSKLNYLDPRISVAW